LRDSSTWWRLRCRIDRRRAVLVGTSLPYESTTAPPAPCPRPRGAPYPWRPQRPASRLSHAKRPQGTWRGTASKRRGPWVVSGPTRLLECGHSELVVRWGTGSYGEREIGKPPTAVDARLTFCATAGRSGNEVTLPRPFVVAFLLLAVCVVGGALWIESTPRPTCWATQHPIRSRGYRARRTG